MPKSFCKEKNAQEAPCASALEGRNVPLDFLRVLCMFLIVLGHAMIHGHVLDELSPDSVNYYVVNTVRAFLSVHVNCFVLISGYFLCKREFNLKHIVSIWGRALFWSLTLYLLLCAGGVIQFDIGRFVKACLPFTQQRYWFVTTYILMYTLLPLLNAAIRAMSQRQHAYFLAAFFIVYIVLQNLFFWEKFTSTNSYDPLFFAFLYMIAAYLRLYPAKRARKWYIIGYFLACVFAAVWKIAVAWLSKKITGEVMADSIFMSYSSITMVIASVCLFRFFEGLCFIGGAAQKIVKLLSSLTFGIYLIHEQPEIRVHIWGKLFRSESLAQSPFLIFSLLGTALFVFLICGLLEYIRQRVFEFLSINKLVATISDEVSCKVAVGTKKVFQLGHQ